MFRSVISHQRTISVLGAPRLFHTGTRIFAGHSKWANIKHDKAKNDAKRSREAYAMAQKIESAARMGGVDGNASLETLIEKAKKLNVTKKIIDNAIKRGTGEVSIDGPALSDVQYEFVGPGGVAMIITATTDNKARTVMLVKNAMGKFNASLSPCLYLFQKKGEVIFEPLTPDESLDDIFEVAIDIGAEDVGEYNDVEEEYDNVKLYRIISDPTDVFSISNQLKERGYKLKDASTKYIADIDNEVPFPEEFAKGFNRALTELDLVNEVTDYFTNIKEEE
ncbi:transcriptional regulator TACO1-like protein [Scheffersomyces coipomensis]|uniref:transcriptional regulator TACO1-like protein n=1 Tax=Scheffersomyces coipomensis TaxID=1788519 RepID=UPI00315C6BC8